MKFPEKIEKCNHALAVVSGLLIFLISLLAVYEVIMRNVLKSPSVWTADLQQYLLIWAIFVGSGYAFQEHGHVRVDLLTSHLPKGLRKICAIIAHLVSLFFACVLEKVAIDAFRTCIKMNKYTYAMVKIPQWILEVAIIIGGLFMIVTLIFIILDLIKDGEKYL